MYCLFYRIYSNLYNLQLNRSFKLLISNLKNVLNDLYTVDSDQMWRMDKDPIRNFNQSFILYCLVLDQL